MAQKLIRDIPDEVMDAIEKKAAEDRVSAEAWLRSKIVELAKMPTIRKRYSFKAIDENGAYVTIKRFDEGFVQRGAKNCSQAQFDAYQRACDYAERNEAGDYEKAYQLLLKHFDEVFPS